MIDGVLALLIVWPVFCFVCLIMCVSVLDVILVYCLCCVMLFVCVVVAVVVLVFDVVGFVLLFEMCRCVLSNVLFL